MSKPATSRRPPTPPSPDRTFKRGDRVRFIGAGREWLGVVVEREMPDGGKSIHPRHDDTAIYLKFNETGIVSPVSLRQVEKLGPARDRR